MISKSMNKIGGMFRLEGLKDDECLMFPYSAKSPKNPPLSSSHLKTTITRISLTFFFKLPYYYAYSYYHCQKKKEKKENKRPEKKKRNKKKQKKEKNARNTLLLLASVHEPVPPSTCKERRKNQDMYGEHRGVTLGRISKDPPPKGPDMKENKYRVQHLWRKKICQRMTHAEIPGLSPDVAVHRLVSFKRSRHHLLQKTKISKVTGIYSFIKPAKARSKGLKVQKSPDKSVKTKSVNSPSMSAAQSTGQEGTKTSRLKLKLRKEIGGATGVIQMRQCAVQRNQPRHRLNYLRSTNGLCHCVRNIPNT
ncbi:hypothetical protein IEQ34_002730 [Dendrobium chrysotoxum]|uniref:Uncharacterized protein n=1 Tax=Dendrobium chrysotoxum TaxID=161865 RepID=A0AAV7HFN4_DENCH|nr:hypothetical protein IEQ34_002730 [Dendrobium chrysotoxum]